MSVVKNAKSMKTLVLNAHQLAGTRGLDPVAEKTFNKEGYGSDIVLVFEHEQGAPDISPEVHEITEKIVAAGLETTCTVTSGGDKV